MFLFESLWKNAKTEKTLTYENISRNGQETLSAVKTDVAPEIQNPTKTQKKELGECLELQKKIQNMKTDDYSKLTVPQIALLQNYEILRNKLLLQSNSDEITERLKKKFPLLTAEEMTNVKINYISSAEEIQVRMRHGFDLTPASNRNLNQDSIAFNEEIKNDLRKLGGDALVKEWQEGVTDALRAFSNALGLRSTPESAPMEKLITFIMRQALLRQTLVLNDEQKAKAKDIGDEFFKAV